jgi:hypothetical protein
MLPWASPAQPCPACQPKSSGLERPVCNVAWVGAGRRFERFEFFLFFCELFSQILHIYQGPQKRRRSDNRTALLHYSNSH